MQVTRRAGQVFEQPDVDLGAFQARGTLPAAACDSPSHRLDDGAKQFHPFIVAGRGMPPAAGHSIDLDLGAAEFPP